LELQDKKIVAVALAIIYRVNPFGEIEIMLQERKSNLWEFPGGKVEGHENFSQALIREIREELGIKLLLDQLEFFDSFTHEYEDLIVNLQCYLVKFEFHQQSDLCWFFLPDVSSEKISIIEGSRAIVSSLIRKFYV